MRQRIEAEINRLVDAIIKKQNIDGTWDFPFETGIATDCYMIILLRTLEIHDEGEETFFSVFGLLTIFLDFRLYKKLQVTQIYKYEQ
ncbi:hypothetical protein [Bacillus alveayuensis]|uniref:hypothetical protein n=1 Tax=Aeribacillus alveayuensis TaxID=279215 RepID=UPI0005D0F821|nr:hypothetical protein [Bacillus alveayuensis]